MEPTTFVLWRDALDQNYFTIGAKIVKCPSGDVVYNGWGQVFIDGINEMFGKDLYDKCRHSKPGIPIEVIFRGVLDNDDNECVPAT